MAFVKNVVRAMERIAPLSLAEKWDNVGLLIEAPKPRPNASRVLLTIDLTPAVLQEALAHPQTGVIISYHPPIFKPLSSITLSNPLQNSILNCIASGISVYSPHTALDCVKGGVNDWLAQGVLRGSELGVVSILGEEKGGEAGVGRLVTLSKPFSSINVLARHIREFLQLEFVQVASPEYSGDSPVSTIALCAGSGGSVINGSDADVYFTGEMSHHEVLAAVAAGKHVILCGHTNTERGYLPTLLARLQEELSKEEGPFEVTISQTDAHPLQFV